MLLTKKVFLFSYFAAVFTVFLSMMPSHMVAISALSGPQACCCAPSACHCGDSCGTAAHHSSPAESAQLVWKAVVCDGPTATIMGTILIPKFYLLSSLIVVAPVFLTLDYVFDFIRMPLRVVHHITTPPPQVF